jgi:hypothetical protein
LQSKWILPQHCDYCYYYYYYYHVYECDYRRGVDW